MAIGIVLGVGIGIALSILLNRYKPVKKVEISEDKEREIEKQKKLRKNFNELMQYDYETALKRGEE